MDCTMVVMQLSNALLSKVANNTSPSKKITSGHGALFHTVDSSADGLISPHEGCNSRMQACCGNQAVHLLNKSD